MTVGSLKTPPAPLPAPPPLDPASGLALFLDFDGTLVDIAPTPDAIAVAPGLSDLLAALRDRLGGRLALVSGRALADIDRHLALKGVTMAGSHGGELRVGGTETIEALTIPVPDEVVTAMRAMADAQEGLQLESKPFSVALHYRARPDAGADVLARADALAARFGLEAKRGKMVVELLSPGADKGSVVRKMMQMPPFAGSRALFIGDDITDEDAFESVLDHHGGGVLVGPERTTAALWRLDGVAQVHAWLKAAVS